MSAIEAFLNSKDEGMRTINILWSGGLDSTYLLFRLSSLPVDIYPYYILEPCRHSTQKELDAINMISTAFSKRDDINVNIHKIRIFNKSDIKPYADIEKVWECLSDLYALGNHYSFLANFARQYDLKLVVVALFGERSKVEQSMKKTAQLKESETFPNLFLRISCTDNDDPTYTILKRSYFPHFMRHLEKTSEWEYFKQHDAEDIARMTWFCHRPVLGMTCGLCNPCKDALNEGMAWRVSKLGYVLGTIRHYTFDVAMSIMGKIRKSTTT